MLVGAEDVKGVKTVAEEALVAVVAMVELLGGPGVHTSCSNDRFELTRAVITHQTNVREERRLSALYGDRWRAFLMPDLDGGGDSSPLYRSGRFPSDILRLDPLQIG